MTTVLAPERVKACLDACAQCMEDCEACAQHCMQSGDAGMAECARLCLDCAT